MCKASQAVLAVLLSGCTYLGSAKGFSPAEFASDPRWIRVGDTPLVLQAAQHDCGAAAVAMVLGHWNRSLPFDQLISRMPRNYTERYSAQDLKTVLESQGLRARMIKGAQEHLRDEISKGRPVIVGLGKVSLDGAMAHFEVVVALHPVEMRVVTLDPARGWRENSLAGFLDEWDMSGRAMIVAYEMQ